MSNSTYYLVTIVLMILLPIVPTLVVYRLIPAPQTGNAGAQGTILGVKFKTSGAIATYLICAFLVLLIAKSVFPKEYAPIRVEVQVEGDAESVKSFMQKAEVSTQLTLTSQNLQPIRFDHFNVNTNKMTLTAEQQVPPLYLGKEFNVALTSPGQHLNVSPSTVILQKDVLLKASLDVGKKQTWEAALDAYLNVFSNQAEDLYSKEIILLSHDSDQPLESIILHGYLGPGQVVYFEVSARVIDRKNLEGLKQQWARSAFENLNPDEYATFFENRFREYKQSGDEVALRHFTNDDYNLPGQGERRQRGVITLDDQKMIPTIGPVPGGIPSDKVVIIFVDSWRKIGADFRRRGAEETMGDTFERATERLIYGISSGPDYPIDLYTVRAQFKQNLITPVQKIGGAQIRRGTNSVILDLNDVPPASVVQLFWTWK